MLILFVLLFFTTLSAEDQIVGIYGNILYPQDQEQIQLMKLNQWTNGPFPLSADELNDISVYVLERFPITAQSKEMAPYIPVLNGRSQVLRNRFLASPDKNGIPIELIQPPFTWDIRLRVFKQMVDKLVPPNSPYFLALQEVTPQALHDLKATLADRNLKWISFNNISGKETLLPRQEQVFGEATAFTSTIALSPDLKVLKIALGDLPTESGSQRKILGVRVLNTHNQEIYNLFTTHTDHTIQNDIYARTAAKIHTFITNFIQDDQNKKYVLGGDFNAFANCGGDKYIEQLLTDLPNAHDFRETNYSAPYPIAWSTFIGHLDDTYSKRIAIDGIVEPNAFDHIIVGNGIQVTSASREAAVYNEAGKLLDYCQERDAYMKHLQNRITFSDHFFNIVRFE